MIVCRDAGYRIVAEAGEWCFDPAEQLYLPFIITEFDGDEFGGCGVAARLGYGLLVRVGYGCGTSGCVAYAAIRFAADMLGLLKPRLVRVLQRLWAEYVDTVKVWYRDECHHYDVVKWRKEPEDELENICYSGTWGKRRIRVKVPLRRLRQLLLDELGSHLEEVQRILTEARREIEELERRIEESRASGELEVEVANQLVSHTRRLRETLHLNIGDDMGVG